jgi:MerR family transcriptional regulator, light-induced transcriptional regulator
MSHHRDDRDAVKERLGHAYAEAILSGDEVAAEVAIREAMDASLTSAEIDDEIIAPALWFVGELWERGEITVADEHLATEISMRVLALQHEALRLELSRATHLIMLAAPAGERHVVALGMIANLLREAGYRVVMLGGDVPEPALAASASRYRPAVICLSATMPGGDDKLIVAMHEAQRAWPDARFVVGGSALTSRVRGRPGIEVCERVPEAVDAVDALVKRADQN